MFLDLFYLLDTAPKRKTMKKEQALKSRPFSKKCLFSMENDLYSLYIPSLFNLVRSKFIHNVSQVSFGSYHWPSVPEYVEELIEALIAKKAPFVR